MGPWRCHCPGHCFTWKSSIPWVLGIVSPRKTPPWALFYLEKLHSLGEIFGCNPREGACGCPGLGAEGGEQTLRPRHSQGEVQSKKTPKKFLGARAVCLGVGWPCSKVAPGRCHPLIVSPPLNPLRSKPRSPPRSRPGELPDVPRDWGGHGAPQGAGSASTVSCRNIHGLAHGCWFGDEDFAPNRTSPAPRSPWRSQHLLLHPHHSQASKPRREKGTKGGKQLEKGCVVGVTAL